MPGVSQRARDERRDDGAVRRGVRDVMGLGSDRPSRELGDGTRPARQGPVRALEDQEPGPLAQARPAPPAVEGTTRLGVDRREGVEAAERQATQAVARAGHDRVHLSR